MPLVYAIFSLVSIASRAYGYSIAAVNANAAASARRSPVRIRCPDHVGDATREVVFGTPSQVVLDRTYHETGVVDVSGAPGAVAEPRHGFGQEGLGGLAPLHTVGCKRDHPNGQ